MSGSKFPFAAFAVIASVFLLVSESDAIGAAPVTPTPKSPVKTAGLKTNSKTQSTQNQTNTAALAALKQARALLDGANHDYQGHRAKAEALVAQAIRELTPHHHQPGAGTTKPGRGANPGVNVGNAGKGNANKEPQAQSDAQLQQAVQLLNGVVGQIGNHPKASAHIQNAIAELNTALKIK
jgi:hypothetical protein